MSPTLQGTPRLRVSLLAICATLLLLPACATRVPFTVALRRELTDADLARLQFYVSQEVQLSREMRSEEKGVTAGHTFRVEKGRRIEEIVLEDSTPGVVVGAAESALSVSFEPPIVGREAALTFAPPGQATDRTPYHLAVGEGQTLKYGGTDFRASNASLAAFLEIDLEQIENIRRERRVLPGRRVGEEDGDR